MKLNLFLLILAVLLLSNLGLNVKEYFQDKHERGKHKRHFSNFAEYDAAKDRDTEMGYRNHGRVRNLGEALNETIRHHERKDTKDYRDYRRKPWQVSEVERREDSKPSPSHAARPSRLAEDDYILKSRFVPTRTSCDKKCPECPPPIRCPELAPCPQPKACPPCPACARCPEAPFRCEKVPNYKSPDTSFLPRPWLNDFSEFGGIV